MTQPKQPHHRIYSLPFATLYPLYLTKVTNKGRNQAELDAVIHWLTGYTKKQVNTQMARGNSLEDFFHQAPKLNPKRKLITGSICGIRVEDIADPLMQNIRYLDKLVDEVAKGKAMEKILRQVQPKK